MKTHQSRPGHKLLLLTLITATFLLINVFNSVSAETLKKIVWVNQSKLSAAVKSQSKINDLADDTKNLLHQFRQTNAQIDALEIYNQQLNQQIGSQKKILTELGFSISQVSVIERRLPMLMQKMIVGLDQFVVLDAPFHLAERRQRVEQLKANFNRPDISLAEKFRQILEAYKIENEYGRKIDSYEDKIEINGQASQANILRVGRIALLYQTRDRKYSGWWDRSEAKWKPLDASEYRNAIVRGLRMAKNQAAIELIQLPIARVEVQQ